MFDQSDGGNDERQSEQESERWLETPHPIPQLLHAFGEFRHE
jgi:hypothetical protein